ncbi:MAG: N-acetyltransferase [Candidatus Omnitrophota bacterium]
MIRKARIADAPLIHALIKVWAKKGKVLDRPLNYIYENIRDYWVDEHGKRIVACCALHVIGWEGLAEIKSLIVSQTHQNRGIGASLVVQCLAEAKGLGAGSIFALTFAGPFFKKLGFRTIDRKELPHKIWNDCVNCVNFPDCREEAVLYKL